jgi:RNA polymerase sigma-70 factor (ECF subfamily)
VEPNIAWLHVQLRRLGVAERDLADMTQETLAAVHGRWMEYDPERPLRPWLLAFAARVAANHRRRADVRRERTGLMDTLDDGFAHHGDAPDDMVSAAQDRALVLAGLDALDDDRRVVFVAAEIEGMTMPDITASLGIPLNTGYTRLRLARADFVAAVTRLRSGGRR